MAIEISTLQVTGFQQNARILIDSASRDAILVDPGGEISRIFEIAQKLKANVSRIFLTHAHLDHGGGVALALKTWQEHLGIKLKLLSCGEQEQYMRSTLSQQAAIFGFPVKEFQDVPDPDLVLKEGDEILLGSNKGTIYETPGHSPGHLSLYFEKQVVVINNSKPTTAPILIAGDALFQGSIGRTDLPGGDYETLISSIKNKILILPDETIVMPGHGPDTLVGIEKISNPFLN